MTPALAAAGKNIKNVAVSMIRIFAVGPDFLTKEQADSPCFKGRGPGQIQNDKQHCLQAGKQT